jgi:hypothetical protein
MDIQKMKSNYGKGPSTGNASARPGKRETFAEGKKERSNLADSINAAFAARSPTTNSMTKTTIDPTLENVVEPIKPKRFKK